MPALTRGVRTDRRVEAWDILRSYVNMALISIPPNTDLHIHRLTWLTYFRHRSLLHGAKIIAIRHEGRTLNVLPIDDLLDHTGAL